MGKSGCDGTSAGAWSLSMGGALHTSSLLAALRDEAMVWLAQRGPTETPGLGAGNALFALYCEPDAGLLPALPWLLEAGHSQPTTRELRKPPICLVYPSR